MCGTLDISRRLDAGRLAEFVAEQQLDEEEAMDLIPHLVSERPREVFTP